MKLHETIATLPKSSRADVNPERSRNFGVCAPDLIGLGALGRSSVAGRSIDRHAVETLTVQTEQSERYGAGAEVEASTGCVSWNRR